jgi:hypothetical protein
LSRSLSQVPVRCVMRTLEDPSLRGIVVEPTNIAIEVVNGRKSWKRAKGERVWPPELEAALIEGTLSRPTIMFLAS